MEGKSYQSNCDRDDRPEAVDQERKCAATLEGNRYKLDRVETSPATLAVRVDALCDLMPIVVVLRERLPTTIPSTVGGVLS